MAGRRRAGESERRSDRGGPPSRGPLPIDAAAVLAAVLQAVPAAIVVLDAEDRIQLWSTGAERLFGWSATEVAARPLALVLGKEAAALADGARASERATVGPLTASAKAGPALRLIGSCVATPDGEGARGGVVAVFQDPGSGGRDVEQRLVEAQRLEAIDRIGGSIAHDLKNVFSAIKGFAIVASEEFADDHHVRGDTEQILRAVERGAALTHKLLAMSRNPGAAGEGTADGGAAAGAGATTIDVARAGALAAHADPEATILIVEDDDLVRVLTVKVLRRRGYRVLEASGPTEAAARATEEKGPIHLLLSDVGLPHANGPELARKLAAARPDMKVLFMSGYGRAALVERGVTPGPGVLEKPFSPEVLLDRIRALLDGRARPQNS